MGSEMCIRDRAGNAVTRRLTAGDLDPSDHVAAGSQRNPVAAPSVLVRDLARGQPHDGTVSAKGMDGMGPTPGLGQAHAGQR